MIKVIIFLLVFLSSCSRGLLNSSNLDLRTQLVGRQQNTISQKVSGQEEAEKILNRKSEYFKALFEQSFDPYYGTPKWDKQCLAENSIFPIQKFSGAIILPMRLILNSKFEAGYCSQTRGHESYTSQHVVYYYCHGSDFIYRLTVPALPDEIGLNWKELCN